MRYQYEDTVYVCPGTSSDRQRDEELKVYVCVHTCFLAVHVCKSIYHLITTSGQLCSAQYMNYV